MIPILVFKKVCLGRDWDQEKTVIPLGPGVGSTQVVHQLDAAGSDGGGPPPCPRLPQHQHLPRHKVDFLTKV